MLIITFLLQFRCGCVYISLLWKEIMITENFYYNLLHVVVQILHQFRNSDNFKADCVCIHFLPRFRTTNQNSPDFNPWMILIDEWFLERGTSTIAMLELSFASLPLQRAVRISRWMILGNVLEFRYVRMKMRGGTFGMRAN